MADKQIVELPVNSGVTNETLFPAYQPGATSPAQKVSGAQIRAFAEAAGEQAAGDLARGGTFIPHFDPATGLLSWTNDLGLPNPDPVQLEGVSSVNGKTGAVTLSAADVRAYDLAVGQIIPNGADMDTYLELGSYYSPNATVTASLNNAPALGAGFKLIVEQGYGASHRIQKAIFNTTGRILWRYAVGSSWTTGWLEAYTTGSKPSGSYTGNGSATQRTINTGGIGSVVAIWGGTQVTFLTANGGINYSQSSNVISGVPIAEGRFADGVIQIASTANSVNANGLTYNYQVL